MTPISAPACDGDDGAEDAGVAMPHTVARPAGRELHPSPWFVSGGLPGDSRKSEQFGSPVTSGEPAMQNRHYNEDHLAFGDAVRTFIAKEMQPDYLAWEEAGLAPRELFRAAGHNGFLGMQIPEQYGGGGTEDFRFNQVFGEELMLAGVGGAGLGITLHNDICLP